VYLSLEVIGNGPKRVVALHPLRVGDHRVDSARLLTKMPARAPTHSGAARTRKKAPSRICIHQV
jgi:hypothetical protein